MTRGVKRSARAVLDRRDTVAAVLQARGDALVITGLGAPTWDAAAAGDHDGNFYLWGGMGGAAMIGLGLAVAQQDRRVMVITGDGELLMGLGSLATIAVEAPRNFAILIVDNERYGETGMQASHTARGVDPPRLPPPPDSRMPRPSGRDVSSTGGSRARTKSAARSWRSSRYRRIPCRSWCRPVTGRCSSTGSALTCSAPVQCENDERADHGAGRLPGRNAVRVAAAACRTCAPRSCSWIGWRRRLPGVGRARPASSNRSRKRWDSTSGSAELLTTRTTTSPFFAALVNGAASHVVEQDDLHNSSVFHPGTVVFPAVLAAAQDIGASGRALITASVVGYEAGVRCGEFLGRSHYKVFHTTGTAGTIAAAAGVAQLVGLDGSRMQHALGSAGSQAAGVWEFLRDAADSKQLHTGKAAANGLLAAYVARDGLTGARRIFEGAQGMGRRCRATRTPIAWWMDSGSAGRWSRLRSRCTHRAGIRTRRPMRWSR